MRLTLATSQAIRYTGPLAERYLSEKPGISMSTVPMRRHRCLFWLGRQNRGRTWRSGGRFSALCTVLALFTLLAVSGPHLVHHFAEMHPQQDHHTHDEPAPVWPDCQVLFLWQHTPVAESSVVLLPPLLPPLESIVFLLPLWVSAASRDVAQARAPPRRLL
jgi:hypothetical protein